MANKEDFESHAILLPGGAVAAVCITMAVARDYCESHYGKGFKEKGIKFVKAEKKAY